MSDCRESALPGVAASTRAWDAVVIGAGPAGSVAARGLARAGCAVLLVDRAEFPRDKVCGCCLAPAGVRALREAGLGSVLHGAVRLRSLRLEQGGQGLDVALPAYEVMDRTTLDARLLAQARQAGCAILLGTRARVVRGGTVELRDERGSFELTPRCIVVASGMSAGVLPEEGAFAWRIRPESRFGVGATLDRGAIELQPAELLMLIASTGYLGAVRLPDGRVDLAAALDPAAVRRAGGPGELAAELLEQHGRDGTGARAAVWHGTPRLSRHRASVAAGRVLCIGDAAGYIEPITGEGMSWAIEGALRAVPVAMRVVAGADSSCWNRIYQRTLRRRQLQCSLVAAALRRPRVASLCVRALRAAPWLSDRLAGWATGRGTAHPAGMEPM